MVLSKIRIFTVLLATSVCGIGCGHGSERALPKNALLARAQVAWDPATTPRGQEAMNFVNAQVGRRYCWGGTGPTCFDCSGLVNAAWSSVGVRLPRTSEDLAEKLPEVALEDVRPGDILWWPGHVGLYVGRGWVVDALDSDHGVVRRPARDPYRAFRPIGE